MLWRNKRLTKDSKNTTTLFTRGKTTGKRQGRLKKLISRYKKSKGRDLLDVACGTGNHLKYLKNSFSCTGTDIDEEMLSIARKKVKGVVFKKADMTTLSLNKKFDVITCLFSSIGYVKTYANLRKRFKTSPSI